MELVIRDETSADVAAIHAINEAVFETDAEARLVNALRHNGRLRVSLVAIKDGDLVGHIAFSPITVTGLDGSVVDGIGLGPVAVQTSHQGYGIGSRLVQAGLDRVRAAGSSFCVVLGHPEFYPRFGFERASLFGIRWERDVPEAVFFVLELTSGALLGVSGVVRYAPEFAIV